MPASTRAWSDYESAVKRAIETRSFRRARKGDVLLRGPGGVYMILVGVPYHELYEFTSRGGVRVERLVPRRVVEKSNVVLVFPRELLLSRESRETSSFYNENNLLPYTRLKLKTEYYDAVRGAKWSREKEIIKPPRPLTPQELRDIARTLSRRYVSSSLLEKCIGGHPVFEKSIVGGNGRILVANVSCRDIAGFLGGSGSAETLDVKLSRGYESGPLITVWAESFPMKKTGIIAEEKGPAFRVGGVEIPTVVAKYGVIVRDMVTGKEEKKPTGLSRLVLPRWVKERYYPHKIETMFSEEYKRLLEPLDKKIKELKERIEKLREKIREVSRKLRNARNETVLVHLEDNGILQKEVNKYSGVVSYICPKCGSIFVSSCFGSTVGGGDGLYGFSIHEEAMGLGLSESSRGGGGGMGLEGEGSVAARKAYIYIPEKRIRIRELEQQLARLRARRSSLEAELSRLVKKRYRLYREYIRPLAIKTLKEMGIEARVKKLPNGSLVIKFSDGSVYVTAPEGSMEVDSWNEQSDLLDIIKMGPELYRVAVEELIRQSKEGNKKS